jgi:hypothetical protein
VDVSLQSFGSVLLDGCKFTAVVFFEKRLSQLYKNAYQLLAFLSDEFKKNDLFVSKYYPNKNFFQFPVRFLNPRHAYK